MVTPLLFIAFALALGQVTQQPPIQNVTQQETPLNKFNIFLDAFHFESGDLCHQTEVRHYCQRVNEDFIQCVLFDTTGQRLLGVEYIVSERVFKTLGRDEQALWHSHQYEVSKGLAVSPNVPPQEAGNLAQSLVNTYGKTWHTFDEDAPLPLGLPTLMMSFTQDGLLDPQLLERRNRAFNINADQLRQQLQNLKISPVDRSADIWKMGTSYQITDLENLENEIENWGECQNLFAPQTGQQQGSQTQPQITPQTQPDIQGMQTQPQPQVPPQAQPSIQGMQTQPLVQPQPAAQGMQS